MNHTPHARRLGSFSLSSSPSLSAFTMSDAGDGGAELAALYGALYVHPHVLLIVVLLTQRRASRSLSVIENYCGFAILGEYSILIPTVPVLSTYAVLSTTTM